MPNYIDNTIIIAKTKQTKQLEFLIKEDIQQLNTLFRNEQLFKEPTIILQQIEIKKETDDFIKIICATAWTPPVQQMIYLSKKYHTVVSIYAEEDDMLEWNQINIYDGEILESDRGSLPINQQYCFYHYIQEKIKNPSSEQNNGN